jgi:hypothetical protein
MSPYTLAEIHESRVQSLIACGYSREDAERMVAETA